jgi:hypothetical protein
MASYFIYKPFVRSFLSICLIVVLFIFTTNCTLWQFTPQKKYDAIYEGQNLIPNGDIEVLDNGQPVRWNYQGKCAVGFPGFQGDYALTMEISAQGIPAKWETQLNSIKPHTKKDIPARLDKEQIFPGGVGQGQRYDVK